MKRTKIQELSARPERREGDGATAGGPVALQGCDCEARKAELKEAVERIVMVLEKIPGAKEAWIEEYERRDRE